MSFGGITWRAAAVEQLAPVVASWVTPRRNDAVCPGARTIGTTGVFPKKSWVLRVGWVASGCPDGPRNRTPG